MGALANVQVTRQEGALAPVNPGAAQRLTVRVTVPGSSPAVGVHRITAGAPYALMIEGGTPTAAQVAAAVQAMTGTTGEARWLATSEAAVRAYARATEVADSRLFGLQGSGIIKDVFIGAIGKPLEVSYLLGLPVAVAEGAYTVDVTRDSLTPVSRSADPSMQAELIRWAGWQGSALESRTLELVLGGTAMSAVKTLQVARAQGVPI